MGKSRRDSFEPHQVIEAGARVCKRIKDMFYAELPWDMVLANKIAKDFTKLKTVAKAYYPEKNDLDLCHALAGLPDEDYKTILTEEK